MPTMLMLAMLAAFIAAWLIANVVRRHAGALRLVQSPNERSSHITPTPSGGGVGIAIPGLAIGAALGVDAPMGAAALATAALATVIGLVDDRFDVSSLARLSLHMVIVAVLLFFAGPLPAPQEPWGLLPLPLLYALVALAGVWWINLFNFMDGLDGIASSEAIAVCVGAITLAAIAGKLGAGDWTAAWALTISAACLGFLLLNWPPAKIFMGDAGSNFLAVAILAIMLTLLTDGKISYAGVMILPALFVTDATVTLLRRAMEGQRWFSAHRLHAYQKLSRRWGSHRRVTILVIAINLLWLLPMAVMAQQFSAWSAALVITAYTPLVAGCLLLGAGRMESQLPGPAEQR